MIPIDCYIKCPFFQKETSLRISCEGYIEGTCMTTTFSSRKDLISYIMRNCSKFNGGNCIMAKNLYEKYNRIIESKEKQNKKYA